MTIKAEDFLESNISAEDFLNGGDSVPIKKQTFPERISKAATEFAKKAVMAPFESKKVYGTEINPLALAEKVGTETKQRVQSVISDQLTQPREAIIPEEVPAAIGTAASAAVEMAPFTPLELAGAIAGEVAPVAFLGTRTKFAETIGNKFLNTPLKILKKDFDKGVKSQGATLIEKTNLTGSREEVFNKSLYEINKLENQLEKVLDTAPTDKLIDKFDVAEKLDDLLNEYKKSAVSEAEIRKIKNVQYEFLRNLPDKFTAKTANEIKRAIYRKVGEKAYITKTNPVRVEAERTLASALREQIEKIVPSIKSLNKEQGQYIGIRDSLLSAIPSESKSIPASIGGGIIDSLSLRGARALTQTPSGFGGVISAGRTYDNKSLLERMKK